MQEVDLLLQRGPPRYFREIYEVTCEEIEKGFCGPFLSKLEVDDLFGEGQWRPFERFMVIQSDGKQRCIDNARKSGHAYHYVRDHLHHLSRLYRLYYINAVRECWRGPRVAPSSACNR